MAVFGIECDKNEIVNNFFARFRKEIEKPDIIKNPFKARFIKLMTYSEEKDIFIIQIAPIYPPYYLYGGLYIIIALLFTWPNSPGDLIRWYLWPGYFIYLTGIFYSSRFYFLMTKLGMRKIGYKGKLIYLNPAKSLVKMLDKYIAVY